MTHYADRAEHRSLPIVANDRMAKDTYRIRLPGNLGDQAAPGQFFMLRIANCNDPLIGRALALFDRGLSIDGSGHYLDLVYLVKGKFTTRLAAMSPGDLVEVWGPLGNGFSTTPVDHLIMVAGGIGMTPFLALARRALGVGTTHSAGFANRVTLCYGVRTASYLAAVDLFEQAGVEVHLATDDGSIGPPQRVSSLLEKLLIYDVDGGLEAEATKRVVCCGPEPMMAAVSHLAQRHSVACEVSLETPMACGIGVCFTCVARIGSQGDWDYKRTCVEGPVFQSESIQW